MTPRLSLCYCYHNNPQMLDYQRAEWECLPNWVKRSIEIVICDDASDQPIQPHDVGISERLYRIPPPHVMWSHRCATNIAAHESRGEWLLLSDIDHVVPNKTLQELIAARLNPETVYYFTRRNARGEPIKHHPDSWLFHRDAWRKLGGWDERYRGLYGQNARHWDKVRHLYGEPIMLPLDLVLIDRDQIDDASSPAVYYADRVAMKKKQHEMRQQFRRAGTLYLPHQLTVPYECLKS